MKFDDTINCVASLKKLSYSNFKILVVDNDSKNESVGEIKKAFPDLLIIASKENIGYAAGNKIGVDFALKNNFDSVWILNNDCTVRPDSLSELVKSYKRNGTAIFSNLTLMSENPDIIHYAGTYDIKEELQPGKFPTYDKLKGKLLSDYIDELKEKPARIYGHSLFIPIEVIKKFGFMDTEYFMFYEEMDYCHSLNDLGVPSIFTPKAIITHVSTSTFSLSSKMKFVGSYYGARNKLYFDQKFSSGDSISIFSKLYKITELIKYLVVRMVLNKEKGEDYYINIGLLHGLLGLRGKRLRPEDLI